MFRHLFLVPNFGIIHFPRKHVVVRGTAGGLGHKGRRGGRLTEWETFTQGKTDICMIETHIQNRNASDKSMIVIYHYSLES